jgi:CRP-like cAMP-binding protein
MHAVRNLQQDRISPDRPAPVNALLTSLSHETRDALLESSDYVVLDADTTLMTAGQQIQFVHMLETGTAALVGGEGLRGVDLVLIGPENAVGIGLVLGQSVPAHGAVMRISGSGYRIARRRFEEALAAMPELRSTCLQHAASLLDHSLQAAGCNAQHRLVPRLARWILEVCDRGGEDELNITHERLAKALGVRRAGVTMALHELEGRRLIRSTRCRLTVRDRPALTQSACTCYRVAGTRAAPAALSFACS